MLLAVHIVFTWYFVPKSIQEVQIILRYCSFQKAFFFLSLKYLSQHLWIWYPETQIRHNL